MNNCVVCILITENNANDLIFVERMLYAIEINKGRLNKGVRARVTRIEVK